MLPATRQRVSLHSAEAVNRRIHDEAIERVERAAESDATGARIEALDSEWDTERVLQTTFALVTLAGLALGAFVDRRSLALPAAAAGFMLQHALQGWCPPLAIFRRRGYRTAAEIERERRALKVLRGEH